MKFNRLIKNHPVASYFIFAYIITWISSIIVIGPKFIYGSTIEMSDILLMWIFMLSGPSIAGITLTRYIDGKIGLRNLLNRMKLWRVKIRWYFVAILLPPILIILTLLTLTTFISTEYFPGFFFFGIIAGFITGYIEEIGWTGYALPKLQLKNTALTAGIILGLLHGTWHFMAGYLGSYYDLGVYFLPNFITMWIIGMTAMRILQVWVYSNTKKSVFIVQLMHASSSGFLMVFTPLNNTPSNETFWFLIYAIVLWMVAIIIISIYGKNLVKNK